ncbi:MAG: DNA topoisomerase IV subunit A [Spirochaetales bacterium]|nr:DNA topoisomerase IV subunit A [Spirochaetales bacterium]MCF7938074.1 DNA topoisomerase IV subunit A [Spirochaetales bacterium]
MAYVEKLYQTNFIEYASYVIKDRAIPHIDDGMKPVQRRILHALFDMDDGKFHKVANVVGHVMQYHPHGDASIYSALVVLANKEYFIDRQGNFGNILTGDEASAARYIECRVTPFAKEILYHPEITEYEAAYDGRKMEPVVFPAKIPVVLVQGSEGIAVGMSTRILPHNIDEVLEALTAELEGRGYRLYPDFPGGGLADVSDYQEGMGKVLVRARLDTSDPKRIVIREIPYGTTTESIISSIEGAAKKGKVKIASITDYTTEDVEIEIRLPRNVYTQDVVDALFAFTDCEVSISVNLLVIQGEKPVPMTIPEVIKYHAVHLVDVLTAELELEQKKLNDRLHARTLERIFIEERIYKSIEEMKTQEDVHQAVIDGFEPFKNQIRRKVSEEDVERLLQIPIRRISRYDMEKNKKEVREINDRLKKVKEYLSDTNTYAVDYLNDLRKRYTAHAERRTKITSFERVDFREVVERDLELRYDEKNGYIGYGVSGGKVLFRVSPYDRVLVIRKSGAYSVFDVPEKLFVDRGMLYCSLAEKDELSKKVLSVLYKDKSNIAFIKRTVIDKFIIGRGYSLVPEGVTVLDFTERASGMEIYLKYKKKPRMRVVEESFDLEDFLVKGLQAAGVRVSGKEITSGRFKRKTQNGNNGKGAKNNKKSGNGRKRSS